MAEALNFTTLSTFENAYKRFGKILYTTLNPSQGFESSEVALFFKFDSVWHRYTYKFLPTLTKENIFLEGGYVCCKNKAGDKVRMSAFKEHNPETLQVSLELFLLRVEHGQTVSEEITQLLKEHEREVLYVKGFF